MYGGRETGEGRERELNIYKYVCTHIQNAAGCGDNVQTLSEVQTAAGVAAFGEEGTHTGNWEESLVPSKYSRPTWGLLKGQAPETILALPDHWLALMVESPLNQFSILLAFHRDDPRVPKVLMAIYFAWLLANGLSS